MPRGIKQPFPDGWNELKCKGFGWTAVRVRTDADGLPVALEIPTDADGKLAFRSERWRAAAELAAGKMFEENINLRREVERLSRLLQQSALPDLPGGVSS